MKYYLHDTNAFEDEKVCMLFMEFGYEGLGLFYTILEKLAKQEKPIKTLVLKSQLKVGKKLEKCWKFMEEIDIISSNNGDTFNKQLLNFSEKYQIKKEKNSKRVLEWRNNQANIENVTGYKSVSNTCKVKESKVKVYKENNNKDFDYLIFPEPFHFSIKKWIQYKTERKETYKGQLSFEAFGKKLIELSKNNPITAEKIIDQSMANNWAGLFPLKVTEVVKESWQGPLNGQPI
jgi:hypothetical protein